MRLTIFFLILTFSPFVTTQVINASCSACSQTSNPVCVGNTRYLNPCVATCRGINTATSCPDKKVQDTLVAGGQVCYCPLLEQTTCIKNQNSGRYLNPCFAHCLNTNTGHSDYESCSGSSAGGNPLYKQNQTCLSCNTTYSPVCVSGAEFINSCYASCYQQGEPQSSCLNNFNFISQVDNANCICINTVNPVCVQQQRYANPCLAACAHPGIPYYPC